MPGQENNKVVTSTKSGSGGSGRMACLKKELNCGNMGLEYEDPDMFVFNQWTQRPSVVFLIYRFIWTLYFTCVLIYSIAEYEYRPRWKWLIYLTRWTFVVLVATEMLKTVSAIIGYFAARKGDAGSPVYTKMSLLMKLVWVFNNVSVTAGTFVAILYWGVVYNGWALNIRMFTTHAVNAIYILTDLLVTGIPTRWYHFIHPLIYAGTYELFSVVYWSAGGKGQTGDPFIYSVLDYGSKTSTAIGWLFAVLFFTSILHTMHFGAVKLRQFVHKKCCASKTALTPTDDLGMTNTEFVNDENKV